MTTLFISFQIKPSEKSFWARVAPSPNRVIQSIRLGLRKHKEVNEQNDLTLGGFDWRTGGLFVANQFDIVAIEGIAQEQSKC